MNITKNLTHRECLGWWLNENGLIGEGAEIGSAFGQFANRILTTWQGKKLYMVDPWREQPDADYPEATNKVAPWDDWYKSCASIAEHDSRASLIRKLSSEAVKEFDSCSLDFCYIDANHDYRNVMEDLDTWFSKIKPGGLLGGHDCYDNSTGGQNCHVFSALRRWTNERNLIFTVTPCTSFWILK
jgi:hypothetical protein